MLDEENSSTPTVTDHLLRGYRRVRGRRPASFFLLLAIVAMLLLGGQIYFVADDPRQFAFFLSLYFVFFFVVIYRALVDAIEIGRAHFREREKLFSSTVGDRDFVLELGRRVARSTKK